MKLRAETVWLDLSILDKYCRVFMELLVPSWILNSHQKSLFHVSWTTAGKYFKRWLPNTPSSNSNIKNLRPIAEGC